MVFVSISRFTINSPIPPKVGAFDNYLREELVKLIVIFGIIHEFYTRIELLPQNLFNPCHVARHWTVAKPIIVHPADPPLHAHDEAKMLRYKKRGNI